MGAHRGAMRRKRMLWRSSPMAKGGDEVADASRQRGGAMAGVGAG
jgi:hypothetical protein